MSRWSERLAEIHGEGSEAVFAVWGPGYWFLERRRVIEGRWVPLFGPWRGEHYGNSGEL